MLWECVSFTLHDNLYKAFAMRLRKAGDWIKLVFVSVAASKMKPSMTIRGRGRGRGIY